MRRGDFADDAFGVQAQLFAGFGQGNAATMADKQARTERFLQHGDLPGQGGLGDADRLGGALQAADLDDFQEVFERAEVHRTDMPITDLTYQ